MRNPAISFSDFKIEMDPGKDLYFTNFNDNQYVDLARFTQIVNFVGKKIYEESEIKIFY